MLKFKDFFTLAFIVFIMGPIGCSSWSKDKCQSTNWDSLGYSEGSQGRANSSGVYASRCEKHGVKVNFEDYLKGYNRGLAVYCSYDSGYRHASQATPVYSMCSAIPKYQQGYTKGRKDFCTYDNGYRRGTNGEIEGNMCSGAANKDYLSGYKKGRKKFALQEIEYLRSSRDKAKVNLDQVRDDIADKQYQLGRIPRHTQEVSVIRLRRELESDIESLFYDRDQLRNQIENMENQLYSLERELGEI